MKIRDRKGLTRTERAKLSSAVIEMTLRHFGGFGPPMILNCCKCFLYMSGECPGEKLAGVEVLEECMLDKVVRESKRPVEPVSPGQ